MRTWARWRGAWQCVHTEAAGSKQDHYILYPTLSRLQLTRYYLCCIKITNSARHPSCYWVQFNRFEDIHLCIGDGRASGRSSLNILYLCKRRPWLIMLFSCRMCFEYWTWISQSISGGAGGVATPSSSQLVICIQEPLLQSPGHQSPFSPSPHQPALAILQSGRLHNKTFAIRKCMKWPIFLQSNF